MSLKMPTTLSLFVCRPENVSVRETRFSRDKHLGTEGVYDNLFNANKTHVKLSLGLALVLLLM
jgi:hypothetical protein